MKNESWWFKQLDIPVISQAAGLWYKLWIPEACADGARPHATERQHASEALPALPSWADSWVDVFWGKHGKPAPWHSMFSCHLQYRKPRGDISRPGCTTSDPEGGPQVLQSLNPYGKPEGNSKILALAWHNSGHSSQLQQRSSRYKTPVNNFIHLRVCVCVSLFLCVCVYVCMQFCLSNKCLKKCN